ncbi:MAG: hypothetical protein COA79_21035 [Planctomycetota bacterium]|nr:MAG: hypothetical protein COA79_21035 [Planctomycetota bacterium]
MVAIDLSDAYFGDGEQVVDPDDSSSSPFQDIETYHSVARVFQITTDDFPTYVYTNKVKAKYIEISKKKSVCSIMLNDKSINEISEYDGQYGVGLNSNVDGYEFFLVLAEPDGDDIPIEGNYEDNKVVLFSGYNRCSYAVALGQKHLSAGYVGIEEITNEIKIDGILEVDHSYTSSSILSGEIGSNQVKFYTRKTIFNEKGLRDCFNGQLKVETTTRDNSSGVVSTSMGKFSVFDKTGIANTTHWNCAQILEFIINVYFLENIDIRKLLDQKDRIEFISKFARIDISNINNSDLSEMTPIDFDLTGMGFLEAVYKILDESRRYSISKRYETDGIAKIGLRANSKTQRATDNDSDVPIKIPIGEANKPAKRTDIFEKGNVNLNRENKSVGRVVVRSGHLWINTLASTWYINPVFPHASSSTESYVSVGHSDSFSSHPHLVCTDYTESKKGIPSQTYHMMNSRLVGDWLASDLGVNLVDFNESLDQNIFLNEKILEIKPFLFKPYSHSGALSTEDMGVYTALPVAKSDGEYSPVINEEFIFIQPIIGSKDDDWKIAFKYKAGNFGEFVAYAGADKDTSESGKHRFKEYIDNSPVPSTSKYPENRGVVTKEIPLYVRCAVKTDYRLRGIAEIPSYDPKKHRTVYVDDNEIEFALQYRDYYYDEGGWVELPNGWLSDGKAEVEALSKLQKKSEAILDKLIYVANSGFVNLNGVQFSIKVGDMIDEFEGTNRSFDFEAIINKVSYNLELKRTAISYGAKHDR